MTRSDVTFLSGGDEIAAWLYRPADGAATVPCVVMGHGFSLTRHDGLPPYAERLADAGVAVLVFDHRYLGDSGGQPRQRFRRAHQLEDWRNAIAHARTLPGVDPSLIVLWGYSFAGGHAATIAARDPSLAGVILLCPFLDGLPRVLATSPRLTAWILPRALMDLAGRHVTIPVTAPPGDHGAMTFAGEADGFARAVVPGSPWRNAISPGVFATVALQRPVVRAARVACPVWIGLGERDISVSKRAIERFADRAPRAELHRYPHDHFDPFVGEAPGRIAADQVEFLRRQRLVSASPALAG